MKIALVHDHLMEFGGAERVFVALKEIFPDADIYVSAYDKEVVEKNIPDFASWKVRTSWASHIPFFKKLYSPLRFLAPWIWQSFNFSQYDIVISSSGWFMSKGIITRPETKHISYIHHQPRYLYYYETAMEWQRYKLVKIYAHFVNHFLRMWDYVGSQRPDLLITNSQETQNRIRKFYRRESSVVYPPVNIPEHIDLETRRGNYYVTLSRLARAKNIDVIIKAANELKIPLKIVGIGRDESYLKSLAGSTIEFVGKLSDNDFKELYMNAQAFICTAVDEEFGIAPVEALAHGVPVIAFSSGGLKETINHKQNGLLFNELNSRNLIESINEFEKLSESEKKEMNRNARESSKKYSFENFKQAMLTHIESHR
jgi:glycosyltransferase involved in cell wall biosynthesis